MTTISDGLEARGWRVTPVDERHKRIAGIAPNGDAQWNRDGAIISLSNGGLCRYKGATSYYSEPGIVLNAIYIPKEARGDGLGSRALLDFVDSCREAFGDREIKIYCEPCPIGGLGGVMNATELAAWYERAGFARDEKRSDDYMSIYVLAFGPAAVA